MKDEQELSLLGRIRQKKATKKPKEEVSSGPPIETDYRPFDWRRMYAKKYIRTCKPLTLHVDEGLPLKFIVALWIICWVMLIATILLAVYRDKVIDVRLNPPMLLLNSIAK